MKMGRNGLLREKPIKKKMKLFISYATLRKHIWLVHSEEKKAKEEEWRKNHIDKRTDHIHQLKLLEVHKRLGRPRDFEHNPLWMGIKEKLTRKKKPNGRPKVPK
jgi:hypothetical protein